LGVHLIDLSVSNRRFRKEAHKSVSFKYILKYIRAASYRWRYFNLTKGKAQSIAVNGAIAAF